MSPARRIAADGWRPGAGWSKVPNPVKRVGEMPTPDKSDEDARRVGRANFAALIAIVALAVVTYWTFSTLQHSNKFQRCLETGRRNCVDFSYLERWNSPSW